MTTQTELLRLINQLEKEIQFEQKNLVKHKSYFSNLGKNSLLVLASILLPAFLSGWQRGRAKRGMKGLAKFLFLQGLTHLRR